MADPYLHPPRIAVVDAVARALAEDVLPLGDLSSALLPPGVRAHAEFVVRQAGVLAGTACATEAFAQVDPDVIVSWVHDEGARVPAGTTVGTVSGRLSSLLTAERTALNFLGHLSGIATRARAFVDALGAEGPRLWDTRKTTPGLRSLEKAAVRAGGANNHRGNLSDWVMLKDNHLMGLSIAEGVARARDRWPGRTVHVEADRLAQVLDAVVAGADAILLDNMTPEQVRACVDAVTEAVSAAGAGTRRPLLEISGGVTIDNAPTYRGCGADMVSSGSLTNSAPVLDIGLDIHAEPEEG